MKSEITQEFKAYINGVQFNEETSFLQFQKMQKNVEKKLTRKNKCDKINIISKEKKIQEDSK